MSFEGDIPFNISGILDVNNVTHPPEITTIASTTLTRVSIMHPFIEAEQSLPDKLDKDLRWAELEAPLPIKLKKELKWQEEMDERTLCIVQVATCYE